jgi:hypothetical protein
MKQSAKSKGLLGRAKKPGVATGPRTKKTETERKPNMAILQSNDGRFYQIPDDEADRFLVPADKVEETLASIGASQPQGMAPPMPCGTPPVVIYVMGGSVATAPAGSPPEMVAAYGHHGHHGGHHGHHGHHGGFGGGFFGGGYPNYNNYQNYMNFFGF